MIVGIDLDNTIINYTNSFKYCIQKTKKISVIDKKNIMNDFKNNHHPLKIFLKNKLFIEFFDILFQIQLVLFACVV